MSEETIDNTEIEETEESKETDTEALFKHKINTPFAENGIRIDIPEISDDNTVNMEQGLSIDYDTPINKGGKYFDMEIFNGIIHKISSAIKELQEIAENAGLPIDFSKAISQLDISNTIGNITSDRIESIEANKITGLQSSQIQGLSNVAKTGSYNDLEDKPEFALMPINYTGFRNIYANNQAINAPSAQGKYAYSTIWVWASDNTIAGQQAGVVEANQEIVPAQTGLKYYGFIWKIA